MYLSAFRCENIDLWPKAICFVHALIFNNAFFSLSSNFLNEKLRYV